MLLYNQKAFEELDLKFTQNSFGHSCNVCDRSWFKKDLHTTDVVCKFFLNHDIHTEILQRIVTLSLLFKITSYLIHMLSKY